MLTKEEFLRLQKLSAISLNDNEADKLMSQLGGIVSFLGKLNDISGNISDFCVENKSLGLVSGVSRYDDTKALFANSTHEKIGNSIVINSVVDN